MATLSIEILKSKVLLEVGRLTNYIGKKKSAEDGKFETIGTIEADDLMLTQFWDEGIDAITNELKEFNAYFETERNGDDGIEEGLFSDCKMSSWWDMKLEPRVNKTITSFLINYIVSRWLMFTMEYKDAEQYDSISSKSMSQLIEMLYSSTRPTCGCNIDCLHDEP